MLPLLLLLPILPPLLNKQSPFLLDKLKLKKLLDLLLKKLLLMPGSLLLDKLQLQISPLLFLPLPALPLLPTVLSIPMASHLLSSPPSPSQ